MGKTTLTTTFCGERCGVRADWAQAGDAVEVLAGDGLWVSAPHQVAYYCHCPKTALRHAIEDIVRGGGGDITGYGADIDAAMESSK